LKCAWNLSLARTVLGEVTVVPPDFKGRCFEESKGLFGEIEDGICNCSS